MNKAKRVMLIDDDPLVHATFELFIMSSSCVLKSISDVSQAFEYAENPEMFDKPDLLFVDFMLGSILGTDLIRKMRLQRYFDNVPIILFTGYDCEPEDISSLKITDILKKPCSKEDVFRCIDGVCQTN